MTTINNHIPQLNLHGTQLILSNHNLIEVTQERRSQYCCINNNCKQSHPTIEFNGTHLILEQTIKLQNDLSIFKHIVVLSGLWTGPRLYCAAHCTVGRGSAVAQE